jgi:prevent-host-death family protein
VDKVVHRVYAAAMVDDAVSVKELRANLSEYLRRVRDGRVVHIGRHGWPCARIIPEERRQHDDEEA